MQEKDINQYFECLGEIWRDITAMEFAMRSAIAKHDGEEGLFPLPPYEKGKEFESFPDSFESKYGFEVITDKWNSRFSDVTIPKEIVELRHAMAHGVMASVNHDGVDQLIKFRKGKNDTKLVIEFSMNLELWRLKQIRQSLKKLRIFVFQKINIS